MMSFSCNWRISEHSLSPRLRAERVRLQQRRPTSPCKSEKWLQKCSARPCPCWCLIVAMPPRRCRQSAGRPCSPRGPWRGSIHHGNLQRLVGLFREWSVAAGGATTTATTHDFHAMHHGHGWPTGDMARPESPYAHTHSLVPTAAPALRQIDVLRVHHAQMPCQCIVSAERLLLGAQRTVHLLLPGVVDGVLVPGQIVGPRENRVARLPRGRIDSFALVRPRLRVPLRR